MKIKNAISFLIVIALIVVWGLLAFNGLEIGKYDILSYADGMSLGLDLRGGVYVVYEGDLPEGGAEQLASGDDAYLSSDFQSLMSGTITKLQTRLTDAGFTEATVTRQGSNRIRVEIPDVQQPQQLLDLLGSPAHLSFVGPDGVVILEGEHVKTARAGYIEGNKPIINFELTSEGAALFADATARFIGQTITIWLDDEQLSAPTVNAVISGGQAYIEGFADFTEAERIAGLIQSGALPLDLEQIELRTISATLGEDAMSRSVLAAGIGIVIIMLFMIAVYRLPGFVASIALAIYVLLDILLLICFSVQLTLPGIAGIILSIAMAVDANVIIFERVKEELRAGKTVRASVEAGFKRAFSAIVDTSITSLIAAIVLGMFGTGPIKGFAYTLAIGVIVSVFTAVFITRFLLRRMIGLQIVNKWLYGVSVRKAADAPAETPVKEYNKGWSTVKLFRPSLIILAIILVAGIAGGVAFGGLNSGIDFTGGTMITIAIPGEFDSADVEQAFNNAGIAGAGVAVTNDGAETSAVVRIRDINDPEEEAAVLGQVEAELINQYPGTRIDSIERISAVAGADLIRNAVLAVAIACLLMMVYIWIRFELKSGVGTVAAILSGVAIMIAAVAISRTQLNTAFIAAILTIVGYSINNTIVIFDRVRENHKKYSVREVSRSDVADISVRESLTRTINTTITTFITLLLVYIMGVESIKEFTFPLLVGMVAGVWTSIFIAPPIWGLWMDRGRGKGKGKGKSKRA